LISSNFFSRQTGRSNPAAQNCVLALPRDELHSPGRLRSCLFLLLTLALILGATGCRKKQLTVNQARAITRQLVFAAKNSTGGRAEIGMRPESLPPGRASRNAAEPAVEHIYITLPTGRGGQADAATLRAVEDELDRVALAHDLVRVNLPGATGLVRFDYRLGERRTHAIHIITPMLRARSEAAAAGTHAANARLAVIIDDLGYDRAAADALFALPYPLTVSVLPNHLHSADIAEEANRRGYEVMLHLPMESGNGGKPEPVELRPGMKPAEAAQVLAGMLDNVPHAVGVNNHQGSRATADPQLMAAIMPALRERSLFFIDSRTTTETVAYDAAVRAGVPAASRKVFLDDAQTREAVRKQLELAERDARKEGSAIAIGHPHPATLQTLEEYLPQLQAHGVRLVFASDLVH